jgi:hypothetical protein
MRGAAPVNAVAAPEASLGMKPIECNRAGGSFGTSRGCFNFFSRCLVRQSCLAKTQGKPSAYLVDVETFEGLNQKIAILEGITKGEGAIAEGNIFSGGAVRREGGVP